MTTSGRRISAGPCTFTVMYMYRPSVPIFALNIVLFAFELLQYRTSDPPTYVLFRHQNSFRLCCEARQAESMHETVHTRNVISAVYLQHDQQQYQSTPPQTHAQALHRSRSLRGDGPGCLGQIGTHSECFVSLECSIWLFDYNLGSGIASSVEFGAAIVHQHNYYM